MRMADPVPQFTHFVRALTTAHPDLAYLHAIEPRIFDGVINGDESNGFLRSLWAPRPFISSGGYTRALALEAAEETGDLISFGRDFISNVGAGSWFLQAADSADFAIAGPSCAYHEGHTVS
jgi:NADPH2 dehydrogenase